MFNLVGSSIWVRADLIASGAPSDRYIGLKIERGQIRLSDLPVDMGGKLTIPVGEECNVKLELATPADVPDNDQKAGRDAREAQIDLPDEFDFEFSHTERLVRKVGIARWRLYGQKINFRWDKDGAPAFLPGLNMVLIPFLANMRSFGVAESNSPFAEPEGNATIQRSFWVLPTATVDIAQPVPAEGVGGMTIQLEEGLTLSWRGLRRGPVDLPNPWIVLFPGLLTIIDLQAGNRYARQRFLLWQDEAAPFRSSVHLQYTESFPLHYAVNAEGAELLSVTAHGEARQDRPVDVSGSPLAVRSENSLLLLSYTDAQQWVYLFDNDIIADNAPATPAGTAPPEIEKHALGIRNALFTVTPVNGYLLFAELLDEELVDRGSVLLTMGMYILLPTLPDPYAANTGIFGRTIGRGGINTLLVAQVLWEKVPDSDFDAVTTNFFFAPAQNTNAFTQNTAVAGV